MLPTDNEPLVVAPKRARAMLDDMSPQKLKELIDAGELDSYKEGDYFIKITVASIKRYIAKKIAMTAAPKPYPQVPAQIPERISNLRKSRPNRTAA